MAKATKWRETGKGYMWKKGRWMITRFNNSYLVYHGVVRVNEKPSLEAAKTYVDNGGSANPLSDPAKWAIGLGAGAAAVISILALTSKTASAATPPAGAPAPAGTVTTNFIVGHRYLLTTSGLPAGTPIPSVAQAQQNLATTLGANSATVVSIASPAIGSVAIMFDVTGPLPAETYSPSVETIVDMGVSPAAPTSP